MIKPTLVRAFVTLCLALPAAASESNANAYAAFRRQYRGASANTGDAVSYEERLKIFARRREEVERHNARIDVPWTAVVNKFADYTDAELKTLSGNRRELDWYRNAQSRAAGESSLLQVESVKSVPPAVDWRSRNLTSVDFVHDQGSCGSCWAAAAVSVLEVHAEIATGKARELSFEQVTECSPNPDHCGGDGGCQGATKGIALNWILNNGGVALASDYLNGYKHGGDQTCKQPLKNAIRIGGVRHLPVNQYEPLIQALATKGPVSVSVAADGMHMYQQGVYNGCNTDAISNHAVMMLGYDTDPASGLDYWLLRNSWGDSWGERGYMRIQRHDPKKHGHSYCGTDYEPSQGIGCRGGPSQVEICGMCGVLYDLWYPEMVEEIPSAETFATRQDSPLMRSTPRLRTGLRRGKLRRDTGGMRPRFAPIYGPGGGEPDADHLRMPGQGGFLADPDGVFTPQGFPSFQGGATGFGRGVGGFDNI